MSPNHLLKLTAGNAFYWAAVDLERLSSTQVRYRIVENSIEGPWAEASLRWLQGTATDVRLLGPCALVKAAELPPKLFALAQQYPFLSEWVQEGSPKPAGSSEPSANGIPHAYRPSGAKEWRPCYLQVVEDGDDPIVAYAFYDGLSEEGRIGPWTAARLSALRGTKPGFDALPLNLIGPLGIVFQATLGAALRHELHDSFPDLREWLDEGGPYPAEVLREEESSKEETGPEPAKPRGSLRVVRLYVDDEVSTMNKLLAAEASARFEQALLVDKCIFVFLRDAE